VVDGSVYIGGQAGLRAGGEGKVYALNTGVSGSSEGSRVNLGTLGHHQEWAKQENKEGSSTSDVELRNVEISPKVVDGTNKTHTLTFEVVDLSADGEKDDFTISLPSDVDVDGVTITEADGLGSVPADPVPQNPIEFAVNATSLSSTPVDVTVELELSPSSN
jgi:hypothetical protein